MKVLVTGYGGQLGFDTVRELERRGIECRGVDMQDFDLKDAQGIKDYFRDYRPTAVVHCAAYTNVDKAESQPEICAAVNGMGTMNLVRAALSVNASVVYISTDYVFPGTGDKPWQEDDPYGPVNVYGMSKVQGEDAVRSLMTRYFILRSSWIFGKNGHNFVDTMLRLGKEKKELRVVNDQIGSPTYSRDLARVICDLLATEKYGIYHVHNEGYMSWYDFACMIMAKAGLKCRVLPVPTSDYPTPARRPLNSRLDSGRLAAAGIRPMPSVEDALDRYLQEIGESSPHS